MSELGMTYFLRLFNDDDTPFLALPVFLVRCFRHSAIYINKRKGISRPQDLAGKRIGELGLYGHDGGVMPKGILSDEYGVTPEQSRWIVGRIDFPMEPVDFVPHPHPTNVEVEWADEATNPRCYQARNSKWLDAPTQSAAQLTSTISPTV